MFPQVEAWHEAGHALVARLLGGTVRTVTLESELCDHAGHTEVLWEAPGPGVAAARRQARREALVALAGPIAEQLHADSEPLEPFEVALRLNSWRGDEQAFERALAAHEPDPAARPAVARRLAIELFDLLSDPDMHERVARIADALDAHQTLDEALFDEAAGFSERA
jgi:hypothetical protein